MKSNQSSPIALLSLISFVVIPVSSAKAFTITQTSSPQILFSNLLGDTIGLSNFSVELNGDARAFGIFQDDPFRLDSGIILSTGKVGEILGANTVDGGIVFPTGSDISTDFDEQGEDDQVSIVLEFDVDSSKDTLYFQYVFGSEEFVEWGGSNFNDSFEFLLNGVNLAILTDGRPATINNLILDVETGIPSKFGPYHPDFRYSPVDSGPVSDVTKLDGYTRPLLFSGPLIQNERNRFEATIRDVHDGIYDSVVFFKTDTFGTVKPPSILGDGLDGSLPDDGDGSSTSIPEPASSFGIILLSSVIGLCRCRKL